jgi:hypothetical protein
MHVITHSNPAILAEDNGLSVFADDDMSADMILAQTIVRMRRTMGSVFFLFFKKGKERGDQSKVFNCDTRRAGSRE